MLMQGPLLQGVAFPALEAGVFRRVSGGTLTCNPKTYKIVGYDPLIIGSNP